MTGDVSARNNCMGAKLEMRACGSQKPAHMGMETAHAPSISSPIHQGYQPGGPGGKGLVVAVGEGGRRPSISPLDHC